MKYTDRVYGEFEITEPVILELINSLSLQRLKDVDQAGYRPVRVKPEVDPGELDNSRFAHSLGVYLLLRKYNAPIAGPASAIMFRTVGDCLRYALQKEYISEDDLYTTDNPVIEKVKRFLNNFVDNGILKRVSEVEANWNDIIKQEAKPKQYFLKFER